MLDTAPDVTPMCLEGRWVRLIPLSDDHAGDLYAAGRDAEIWRYMPRPPFASVADARGFIEEALVVSSQLPFAIVERASGRAVGSTRYFDIRHEHRGLEIGWTWIGVAHQRTSVNTECKRLLLGHAFENLGMLRVQLKTDARNVKSQRAIERIGGVKEGVLRAHMIMPDGFVRDSVMYSITARDWPGVKRKLEELEARSRDR
jgi:RimJ/RimL family protein N-acetyltransferase